MFLNMSTLAKKINFQTTNNNGECSGLLIEKDNVCHGGVVVLHGWWGLTEEFQEAASQISDETGLTCLVPDLYKGKVAENEENAKLLMTRLNVKEALSDIRGAVEFLLSKGCNKVAVVGKCMGGALSLAAALTLTDVITAAVAFYGIPNQNEYNCQHIKIPIQLHFAAHDKDVDKKESETFSDMLSDAGVDMEVYEYDAGHEFSNQKQKGYLPGASNLSFYRCCEFVVRHVR